MLLGQVKSWIWIGIIKEVSVDTCSWLDHLWLDTETVPVAEEENTGGFTSGALCGFNPVAPSIASPDGLEETDGTLAGVGAVVGAHDLLDGFGGFIGVVEGDEAHVVVKHVGLDDSVEDVAADEAEFTINGGSGAASEGPGFGGVVRDGGIGVLEVGDGHCNKSERAHQRENCRIHTEPVVHPEVWNKVPDEHVGPAISVAKVVEDGSGSKETQVAEQDEFAILGLVQRAGRVEVVDAGKPAVLLALATSLGLVLVVVVSGNVGGEVQDPSKELLKKEVEGRHDGGLLHQVAQFVGKVADPRGIDFTGLGDKHHVTGHVGGGLVVLAVGDLPGEVRYQQGGVQDEANGVIEDLGRRERLVTALVGQNPDASAEQTLENGVQSPQSRADGKGRDVLGGHKVVEDVKGRGQVEDVTGDIRQTLDGGPLEAMLGDGIADILDGVIGDLELVAKGIDQLAGLDLVVAHGREGSRRRGLTGAVDGRGHARVCDGGVCCCLAMERNALGQSGGSHGGSVSPVLLLVRWPSYVDRAYQHTRKKRSSLASQPPA